MRAGLIRTTSRAQPPGALHPELSCTKSSHKAWSWAVHMAYVSRRLVQSSLLFPGWCAGVLGTGAACPLSSEGRVCALGPMLWPPHICLPTGGTLVGSPTQELPGIPLSSEERMPSRLEPHLQTHTCCSQPAGEIDTSEPDHSSYSYEVQVLASQGILMALP